MKHSCCLLLLLACSTAPAQDTVRMREAFAPGYQYHVSTRVDLGGKLTIPGNMRDAKAPQTLPVKGNSAIEYDERVLALDSGRAVHKTIRLYRRIDLERQVGSEGIQRSTVRAAVRKLVLLRHKNAEVPFSPDGPLTYGEIDLVRTDVFTPALDGLFPENAVRVGARWNARDEAIQELTDLEKIETGRVECRFDQITRFGGRRLARVNFSGTVTGVNEDGPNQQTLNGYCYFDLDSNHLSYLSLKGTNVLLDKDGRELGRVDGQFTLTRQIDDRARELTAPALRGLVLEPSDANTLLLYDNPELGVRFHHSRRWKVLYVRGTQLALDDAAGNGVLLSMEALERMPAAAQFQDEARRWLNEQKARILRTSSPSRSVHGASSIESFSIEMEMAGKKGVLDYHLIRQKLGGATLAVRLVPEVADKLRKDIARITSSLTVTSKIKPGPR